MRIGNSVIILTVLSVLASPSLAEVYWVDGYYRKDGTYVEGHYKTSPDNIVSNNLFSDGVDYDNDGYGDGKVNPYYDLDDNNVYDGFDR